MVPSDRVVFVVPSGWERVRDPASGEFYYWNQKTNETTWTRPVQRRVSLKEAREAKAKLDQILKHCGNTQAEKRATENSDGKPSACHLLKRPGASVESPRDCEHKRRHVSIPNPTHR
ncbi:hypothetical protein PsorP6_009179 [Peronosclerospora sorghi]|uniref:Uncharacterized protein n=1 Tax=Peronosclerospora sorghi TaxID=230839 RepID=A0ACC0W168_9STRA|nr:hypothetical protein PsorP6_009179 [Peronosclerospora sorghi]